MRDVDGPDDEDRSNTQEMQDNLLSDEGPPCSTGVTEATKFTEMNKTEIEK
jgi:hypothetical protein